MNIQESLDKWVSELIEIVLNFDNLDSPTCALCTRLLSSRSIGGDSDPLHKLLNNITLTLSEIRIDDMEPQHIGLLGLVIKLSEVSPTMPVDQSAMEALKELL